MKRFVVLAVMVAFILGATIASAAQLTISGGDFRVHANYVKNPFFDKNDDSDPLNFYQRFRTNFNFVANENLRAVAQLQFGGAGTDALWGGGRANGDAPGFGSYHDVNFRQAYLQFNVPNTQATLKAGYQWWALPNTLGSHIFDARATALVLSTPVNEMVGLTLGYARSHDSLNEKDSFDHFLAIVPMTMDGINLNPFVWYARQGKNFGTNNTSRDIVFAGINAKIDMMDPIIIHADFNYGQAGKQVRGTRIGQTRGWIADLAVEYKMDMFTPMVFALYESGESRTSGGPDSKGKIMPRIAGDLNFTSFSTGGSQFGGTSWYAADRLIDGFSGGATGKMAVGLKLKDISFMDKLSHTFLFAYHQGTNKWAEANYGLFTTKDKAWEVNFDSSYQVYENLAAILELGYLNPDGKSRPAEADIEMLDDASWKAAAGFRYRF